MVTEALVSKLKDGMEDIIKRGWQDRKKITKVYDVERSESKADGRQERHQGA